MTKPDNSRTMGTSSGNLVHILGDGGEKGYRLLCERTKGYLSIDGQSICDVVSVVLSRVIFPLLTPYSEGGKFSQAAIHALAVHIQQNRPRLPTLLSILYHLSEGERSTSDMGLTADGLDFNDFVANVKEALSLDIKEAVRDECIWASMEWKWQEHTKRGC
jgi:hypothetical protein